MLKAITIHWPKWRQNWKYFGQTVAYHKKTADTLLTKPFESESNLKPSMWQVEQLSTSFPRQWVYHNHENLHNQETTNNDKRKTESNLHVTLLIVFHIYSSPWLLAVLDNCSSLLMLWNGSMGTFYYASDHCWSLLQSAVNPGCKSTGHSCKTCWKWRDQ